MVAAPTARHDRIAQPTLRVPHDARPSAAGPTSTERVVDALRRAGLASAAETVAERDHVTGGAAEWWLLDLGADRGVWVQYLRDARLRPGAARVMRVRDLLPIEAVAPRDGVHLVVPVAVGGATYAYPVAAGTTMLAAVLLHGLGAGGAPRQGWAWLPQVCARLGAVLRDMQDPARAVPARPALPRTNDVTRRVRGLLARSGASPVRDALPGFPRLHAALASAMQRFRTEPEPVVLHGRYGSGAMLAGVPASGLAAPDVYVIGWLEATTGPRAYDAGYFIGELMELEAVAADSGNEAAAVALRTAATTFYRTYAARSDQSLPDGFARQVAEFAALKIVDHLARFAQYFGDPGAGAGRLLNAADALLCPDRGLVPMVTG